MENRSQTSSVSEGFAITLARSVDSAFTDTCEIAGQAALVIRRDCTIDNYVSLLSRLSGESGKVDVVDCMLKFWIGDALNQGMQIFGEEAFATWGGVIPWSLTTINNICKTAQVIPPDLRRISLSFRFYCDISGAELDREELGSFVEMAETFRAQGHTDWSRRTRERLNDYKVEQLLRNICAGDKERLMLRYTSEGRPHWRIVREWVTGRKAKGVSRRTQVTAYVEREVSRNLSEEVFASLSYKDVRATVVAMMRRIVDAHKKGEVVDGEGEAE